MSETLECTTSSEEHMEEEECCVCMSRIQEVRPFPCAHKFCRSCGLQMTRRLQNCPLCRTENDLSVTLTRDMRLITVVIACDTDLETVYRYLLNAKNRRMMRWAHRATNYGQGFDEVLKHVAKSLLLTIP